MSEVYVGLTSIDVGSDAIDLGQGVLLQRTQARFLAPLTLENLDRARNRFAASVLAVRRRAHGSDGRVEASGA